MGSLSNVFTSSFKELEPIPQYKATAKLRLRDWECFDGDTGKDSAREVRKYFIPDFSNWKDHDSSQAAFQRLVSDLKAEASK